MLATKLLTNRVAHQIWTCSCSQTIRVVSFATPLLCSMRHCTTDAGSVREKDPPQTPVKLESADFVSIAPMVLLRQALQQHSATKLSVTVGGCDVISRSIFNQYCRESHVTNTDEALHLLEEAGIVVSISNGKAVHLRPAKLLQMYEDANDKKGRAANIFSLSFLQEAKKRVEAAQTNEAAMRSALQPALQRAVKWRHFMWGAALFFLGAHLAIISRLTFFDLDWDIMEPVAYFVDAFISLVFFLYFLRCGRTYTYTECERVMLPVWVKRYAPQNFDWEKYEALCMRVEAEKRMLDKMTKWIGRH